MRLAAIQYKALTKSPTEALKALVPLANQAASAADLVVFPEMAATGYIFDDEAHVSGVAETKHGPSFQILSTIANEHKTWMVFGFPEVDGERFFNSAMVINPSGELAFCYRKTLLYDQDKSWASAGDSGYCAFDAEWGRFGVGICMDLNDDAFVQWCRDAALDAIAFPTNWIEEGIDVWGYWAWRLDGMPTALVAANTYGVERTIGFSGRSAILKSNRIHAAAGVLGDAVICAKF